MIDRACNTTKQQKGVALIMALVILFLLSALAASLIFVTQSEMWASANYRLLTQSRYAAEAGAQAGVNWFKNTYTPPASLASYTITASPVTYSGNAVVLGGSSPNYPDNTVKTAFTSALTSQSVPGLNNATYTVTAELMQMQSAGAQTWQITSVGSIAGARGATTQVVETIKSNMSPTFAYGLFATGTTCGAVSMSGGTTLIDSYNSNNGTYAATVTNSGANIGTEGNVNISSTGHIYGTEYSPYTTTGSCSSGSMSGLTVSGGATVTGGVSALTTIPNYTNPPLPSPAPTTGTQNMSGSCWSGSTGCATATCPAHTVSHCVSLAPGQYEDLNASGGTGVFLSAGTYNINSVNLNGGSPLFISSGPVVLNIQGTGQSTPLNLSGGSISDTSSNQVASNLEILYAGSGTLNLSGGSGNTAVVYAPNASINMSGGSVWYGAIIANNFTLSGGAAIHYDSALLNDFPLPGGGFNMTGFTWSKN